jgi:glutamine synthetase
MAYEAKAYKACIVMLGAVLEGIMLGTIRRADVLEKVRADPPVSIRKLGTQDPSLAEKVADALGFEDYKQIIDHLFGDKIERLKVDSIQDFRNSIHPWKAVKEPLI